MGSILLHPLGMLLRPRSAITALSARSLNSRLLAPFLLFYRQIKNKSIGSQCPITALCCTRYSALWNQLCQQSLSAPSCLVFLSHAASWRFRRITNLLHLFDPSRMFGRRKSRGPATKRCIFGVVVEGKDSSNFAAGDQGLPSGALDIQ
jgi:hypothetical protein